MRHERFGFPVTALALAAALCAAGCGRGADHGAAATGVHDEGIRIGPDRPDVTSQLAAVVEVNGVDPAACTYAWSRNGQPIAGETRAVLPPTAFRKDDLVSVVASLPAAPGAGARRLKAEVRIANAPPSVAAARVAISATPAGTVLQAEQESSDPDGDTVTNDYRWYENGRLLPDAKGPRYEVASASRGGRYAVEIVASDGASRSEPRRSSDFVLENRPPAFSSQPPAVLPADGVYRYTVAAADPDGDAVRFSLADAPAGMTISPTGAIEWKVPSGSQRPKSVHVVVRIDDAKGGEATQTFDFSL